MGFSAQHSDQHINLKASQKLLDRKDRDRKEEILDRKEESSVLCQFPVGSSPFYTEE